MEDTDNQFRLRIVNWDSLYENNRTRSLITLNWVPIPNRMDGDSYTELVDHPDAAAHYGGWIAIVSIASRQNPRGTLPREGAGIPQALARISRLPAGLFEELIPRLLSIGWIECFQGVIDIPHFGAVIPHLGAVPPHESAQKGKKEGNEGKGIQGATLDELEAAWDRHRKHSGRETQQLVFQRVIGMNGKFDVEKFRMRHGGYCEYWAAHGWQFCPLTFLGWIENGMPEPPPEAKPKGNSGGFDVQAWVDED